MAKRLIQFFTVRKLRWPSYLYVVQEGQISCIAHLSTRQVTLGWGHFLPQDCNLNKSTWYFQWSFKSTGLSDQEKRLEIDFQNGNRGGHLGFSIELFKLFFELQVSPILPIISSRLAYPLKRSTSIYTFKMAAVVAILDFQSFLFFIYKLPRYLSSFESIGLSVQKKRQIDFQDGGDGSHFGFCNRNRF